MEGEDRETALPALVGAVDEDSAHAREQAAEDSRNQTVERGIAEFRKLLSPLRTANDLFKNLNDGDRTLTTFRFPPDPSLPIHQTTGPSPNALSRENIKLFQAHGQSGQKQGKEKHTFVKKGNDKAGKSQSRVVTFTQMLDELQPRSRGHIIEFAKGSAFHSPKVQTTLFFPSPTKPKPGFKEQPGYDPLKTSKELIKSYKPLVLSSPQRHKLRLVNQFIDIQEAKAMEAKKSPGQRLRAAETRSQVPVVTLGTRKLKFPAAKIQSMLSDDQKGNQAVN